MATLKHITLEEDNEEYTLLTPTVKAKTFSGAERKFKGKHIEAIIRLDEGSFMVFYYDDDIAD